MSKTVQKHSTTIDGVPYEVEDFTAGDAIDIGAEIMASLPNEELHLIVALVVAALGDEESQQKAREVAEESGTILADALQKVLVAMRDRPGGTSGFLKRLLANTTSTECVLLGGAGAGPASVGVHFDTHFQGRLGHMRRVLQWVWSTLFLVPLLGDLFVIGRGDREQADPTKESSSTLSTR